MKNFLVAGSVLAISVFPATAADMPLKVPPTDAVASPRCKGDAA